MTRRQDADDKTPDTPPVPPSAAPDFSFGPPPPNAPAAVGCVLSCLCLVPLAASYGLCGTPLVGSATCLMTLLLPVTFGACLVGLGRRPRTLACLGLGLALAESVLYIGLWMKVFETMGV